MCKDSLIQVRMKFDCDFFGSTLHQKNGSLRVTRYMSKIIQCCNPWHPLPPPPFGLSVYKPYSDISDMLMPASQTTWSTRPCRWRWKKSWRVWGNKKLELWGMPCFLGVFGWLEVIYGRDWCSRKEGCERTWAKTHVECWNLLGLPGPSGFFESLREPEFLHIYCHCFFSLGGWEYNIYVEISAGGFIFQVEWGECFAFKVPMFPMISCETW